MKKLKPLRRARRTSSDAGSHPDRIVRILSPYWLLCDGDLRVDPLAGSVEIVFFARVEDAMKAKGRSHQKQIQGPYRVELLESGGMRLVDLQSWTPQ